MSSNSLPEHWTICLSKKFKQYYYFNTITNEASWIHPFLKDQTNIQTKAEYERKCPKRAECDTNSENSVRSSRANKPKPPKEQMKRGNNSTNLSAKNLENLTTLSENREKTSQIQRWAADVVKGRRIKTNQKQIEEVFSNKRKHVNKKYTKPSSYTGSEKETSKAASSDIDSSKTYINRKNTLSSTTNTIPISPKQKVNKQVPPIKAMSTKKAESIVSKPKESSPAFPSKKSKKITLSTSPTYQTHPMRRIESSQGNRKFSMKRDHQGKSHRNDTDITTEITSPSNSTKMISDEIETIVPKSRYQPYKKAKKKNVEATIHQQRSIHCLSNCKQIKPGETMRSRVNSSSSDPLQKPSPNLYANQQPGLDGSTRNTLLHNPFISTKYTIPKNLDCRVDEDNMFFQSQQQMQGKQQEQQQFMNNNDIDRNLNNSGRNENNDFIESMDIDYGPELTKEVLREIRGFREEITLSKPNIQEIKGNEEEMRVYTDPLYIVLDTNILLAHLKLIQELKDYPVPGVGPPILYVPWIVLQELDHLKDACKRYHNSQTPSGENNSQKLNVLARNAINFINTCLNNDHPRLKGQTAMEACVRIEGFIEETNDDGIIHAALRLKIQAIHSHIVILSDDRNLCNKSMVAGFKAFSKQNLMMGLRSLFQNGTVAVSKENFAEFFDEYSMQELLAKRRRQSDELSCELQCVLREGLSKVIEDEMKNAYGEDLWLKIVKIQPPWTLHDVFTLLEKHWIAVFGMIVKREVSTSVGQVKKIFQNCEGSPGCLQTTKKLLVLCLKIFEAFATRSSYEDMLTKCTAAVKVLFKKCEEFLQQSVPLKQLPSMDSTSHIQEQQSLVNEAESEQSNLLPQASEEDRNLYEKVREAFDEIWRTVNHFSALIFYSLNVPSPLTNELDPSTPKPHPKEALACLDTMTKCLLGLIRTIQTVIKTPAEELSKNEQVIVKLLERIFLFMKEVMKKDCDIQPNELLHFCQDAKTRTALVQGLSHLDRSYATLQLCVEYHQTVH